MRYADAGYAVFSDDVTSEVSWNKYRKYLESYGKTEFIDDSDPSEYPYDIEVEFGDSELILTTASDDFINRIFRLGDVVYGTDGSLQSFNLKTEYYMHYNVNDGEIWGDVLEHGAGYMIKSPFSVEADRVYSDYIRKNIDDLEAHSFSDDDDYSLGLGKSAFTSGKASKFFKESWYLAPFGNDLIGTSVEEPPGIVSDNSDAVSRAISPPKKFNKKSADKITNFNPSTDTLEIDTDSFGIDSSATFAAGKNKKEVKKKLAKQDFDFLYDQKKGGLYFNENGADKGFGDGGIIAILKGAPELTSGNLEFI